MKNLKFKLGAAMAVVGLSVTLYACKKSFLDKPALGSLSQATLTSSAGVQGLLIGAYSLVDGFGGAGGGWQSSGTNWVYGNVAADDSYKGSDPGDQGDIVPIETHSQTAANGYFNQKWQAVYDGVQRANEVIRVLKNVKDLTDAQKTQITAEARFLRGHYHFEVKKMFNNAPYIDETITYAAGNFNVPNDKDIWPNIEADFQFAFDNLPPTQGAVGRANKYAAEAYLAKAYMFEHKFDKAKTLLDDIIANGVTSDGKKYALDANFFSNFNAATKNSAEAIFSMQQSVNDNSNGNNGGWGDVLNFPYGGGPGGCCGFNQPSQSLANSYQVDALGLPLLDTWNDSDLKSDQGLKSSDAFTPTSQAVDPRLDMTLGRRGIPYLDWGLHPGNDWVRDQNNGGPYAPIKHVYYKSQEGSQTDKSFWTNGVTANNYTFIRFADVLLWRAEVAVEANDLATALTMVNMVRSRVASNPSSWVHTYVDNAHPEKGFTSTLAANYKIGLYTLFPGQEYARKAVRFERKLELAMEGHRFFDLVRYGIADVELNAYIAHEKPRRAFFANATFTKGKSEYFPIPQAQIDLEKGKLKQNPGY